MTTKCIRCKKEREIPGFCPECYLEIYGVADMDITHLPMKELHCNERHLQLVERDYLYTDEIRQSIIKDGLKNPIIVDNKNRILIGHHRYFIGMELKWETIPCYVVMDDTGYTKFIEGGINNLFIIKIDGKIVASITDMVNLRTIVDEWILKTPFWKTSHLVLEAFTGIGGSNDPENWKTRNQERTIRLGGKRNLSRKR